MIKVRYIVALLLVAGVLAKVQAQTGSGSHLDLQAHRGGRGLMPENTIPAMKKAIELGVTTLEMDAVISKDNKVVVSHDAYFNELITTTPGGTFLTKETAAGYLLYTMAFDSIAKFDVGLKPHPDFPRQQKMKVSKPLLSELLDSTETYARKAGRAIRYNIEIKSRQGFDGIRHPEPAVYSNLLIQVLKDKKVLERTTIQSFDIRPLQYIHNKYSAITLSYLVERSKDALQDQLNKLGFTPKIYSPHYTVVTKELVQQAHQKGMQVIPWTVNTVEEIESLITMGVDGIISDYPDLFSTTRQAKRN